MIIPVYHIDAFADKEFQGNPAAVCILQSWLPDRVMQLIAQEHNLAETAFCVPNGRIWQLRWFTPEQEIDLCGHATLATAYVLFEQYGISGNAITFHTQSGELVVLRQGKFYSMSLPVRRGMSCEIPKDVADALGMKPVQALRARDLVLVFQTQREIEQMVPDFSRLAQSEEFGIVVTAPGTETDFVSRYFAPGCSLPEDPVTGSAHCTLVPYWAQRLGKTKLTARQLSKRGGSLWCRLEQESVFVSGKAILFSRGDIHLHKEEFSSV